MPVDPKARRAAPACFYCIRFAGLHVGLQLVWFMPDTPGVSCSNKPRLMGCSACAAPFDDPDPLPDRVVLLARNMAGSVRERLRR